MGSSVDVIGCLTAFWSDGTIRTVKGCGFFGSPFFDIEMSAGKVSVRENETGVSSVLDIDSRRQLFVDRCPIDKLDGVSLKLHEPRDEGIALQLGKP